MSLVSAYPQPRNQPVTSQDAITVQSPAADPDGTLVAQRTLSDLSSDVPSILATHFNSGVYQIISSVTIAGNPASSALAAIVPGLTVSYCFDGLFGSQPFAVKGVTAQGSDVTDGATFTSSVNISHNGQGVIACGVVGGQYPALNSPWNYLVTISIRRVS